MATPGVNSGTSVTELDQPHRRHPWHKARLISTRAQSRHSRTLTFEVADWPDHLAGQHVDVRLTSSDGYSAQRSYSLATPPSPGRISITADLVPHGEVSAYLVRTMRLGDELDVRGPVGGWFVWDPRDPELQDQPILLIAGGSGIVPLMTMIRTRMRAHSQAPFMLVYSVRSPSYLMYRYDLDHAPQGLETRVVYTRKSAPEDTRGVARLGAADLAVPPSWGGTPRAARSYVSGPTRFVDHATNLLRACGYREEQIRTERFGPSGGSP